MHIDGAFSNDVTRFSEPSVFGHGVSPVMVSPGSVVRVVGSSEELEELDEATVVSVVPDELPESSLETAKRATTTTAASPPHLTVRLFTALRRCWRARASRAAARFCF